MNATQTLQFPLVSNYPNYQKNSISMLSTPERIDAHPDFTGRGIQIAFVDSGFSNHPDLTGRIALHVDASTNNILIQPHVMKTTGMSWHGQMTSVIAAGDGRTSQGRFRGVAPDAELVLIKVSTPRFRIKERDILRGLQWILHNRHLHQIRVVNVSVGGDMPTQDPDHSLHRVVRNLVESGIVVVIASGNSGRDTLVPPASAPEAITVGGYQDHNTLDEDQWTLYHHNHGDVYNGAHKPDLIAPANWIASPLLPESETEAEIRYLAELLTAQSEQDIRQIVTKGQRALKLSDEEIENIDQVLYDKLQARIYHHKVIDSNHQHVDGTSVAAPIVVAVIAQMFEANPHLSPTETRQILTETAKPITRFPTHLQGVGILQAKQAVINALSFRS